MYNDDSAGGRSVRVSVWSGRRGAGRGIIAGVAGVSRRMLVSVEQGAVNPSVGKLLRLSDALGIGLPALVERPRPAALKVTVAARGGAVD
jgi:DNA-binding XRE family transcriptional regulator